MGVVYKAHDEKLNRNVAIKVLNAPHVKNSKRMTERFKIEAQNHAQLIHQNIVTVYGFVEFDNLLGIVMEFVDGESLEKVIFKNHHLHIFDVLFITNQLLDGISYAHSRGYIHRDIKPSNIIVNSEGIVKIMDFGISKSIEGETDSSQTSAKIGTIYYMSPEQIKGKNVNKVSDIYSIGCTIYDMLTGNPPFDSKNEFDVMEGHLKENPVSIARFLSTVPNGLEEIVSKLLKKDQSERYQTCAEVKEEIHKFDKLLKTSEAHYFNEKKVRRRLSKKKSILNFALFITAIVALVIFVVFQVRDFMDFKGYEVFKKHSISTLFETEEKIELSSISKVILPTKYALNSLTTDGNKFTIVGDSGTIITRKDSLSEWVYEQLQEKINLKGLSNSSNKIIIGEKSSFLYSISGSQQWYSILDKSYTLNSISFADDNLGFVVGSKGLIIVTADGGKRWNKIENVTDKTLFEINMETKDIGYIAGFDGTILKTNNGGKSWEKQISNTEKYLKSIDFSDKGIGLCVGGNGTILRTTDYGENWVLINNATKRPLNKVRFIDERNAIVVGNNGSILLSSDRGKNWNSVESKYFQNWNDIAITDNGKMYVLGTSGSMIELVKGDE